MSQQIIKLQVNKGDTLFLDYQTYEYGTNREYKTLRGAVQQAIRDFKNEARYAFDERLKNINDMVSFQIRVIGTDNLVYKAMTIK